MNRRYFLKQAVTVAPFVLAFGAVSCRNKNFLQDLIKASNNPNRVLVLIELTGGNDGLNTVIPIDKYSILSAVRRDILIPENKILKLHDTDIFGFHPSMTGLQRMYNDKLISIIHGVGYPEPEFSHFRGKGIKYTANTEKQEIRSGWLGRYLEQKYPLYPKGYPARQIDGPPAIRLGRVSPKITQFIPPDSEGLEEDISIGITNISDLNVTLEAPNDNIMGNSHADQNLDNIRSVSKQLRLYSPTIKASAEKQKNLSKLYPEPLKNPLADQLKAVASLIGSGLNTRVYIVNQSDYDTHADQVDKKDTTQGKHACLLKDLSEAITAFEDDLHLMGKQDDVLGVTFSEFGRRIMCGSYGTDHGTAETMILFGSKLKTGMVGTSPNLPSKVTLDDNLEVQYDFRSVYKTILTDWFGVRDNEVKRIIAQGPEEKLDLFKA